MALIRTLLGVDQRRRATAVACTRTSCYCGRRCGLCLQQLGAELSNEALEAAQSPHDLGHARIVATLLRRPGTVGNALEPARPPRGSVAVMGGDNAVDTRPAAVRAWRRLVAPNLARAAGHAAAQFLWRGGWCCGCCCHRRNCRRLSWRGRPGGGGAPGVLAVFGWRGRGRAGSDSQPIQNTWDRRSRDPRAWRHLRHAELKMDE